MLDFEEQNYIKPSNKHPIDIYTDGGCVGNGTNKSVGGIGIVFICKDKVILKYHKQYEGVTNNQMELFAILISMRTILNNKLEDRLINLYSDSAYSVDGINSWMYKWKVNDWKFKKNGMKKPKNIELWKQILELKNKLPHLKISWVKAYAGNKYNEMADQLASPVTYY